MTYVVFSIIIFTTQSPRHPSYHEEPGRPHWYPEVLKNDHVQSFLDKLYFSSSSEASLSVLVRSGDSGRPITTSKLRRFTLTVAIPQESGSMHGWQIHALRTPGL